MYIYSMRWHIHAQHTHIRRKNRTTTAAGVWYDGLGEKNRMTLECVEFVMEKSTTHAHSTDTLINISRDPEIALAQYVHITLFYAPFFRFRQIGLIHVCL